MFYTLEIWVNPLNPPKISAYFGSQNGSFGQKQITFKPCDIQGLNIEGRERAAYVVRVSFGSLEAMSLFSLSFFEASYSVGPKAKSWKIIVVFIVAKSLYFFRIRNGGWFGWGWGTSARDWFGMIWFVCQKVHEKKQHIFAGLFQAFS